MIIHYLKHVRLSILIYIWLSMFMFEANTNTFEKYLWLEFLDIPYYYLQDKLDKQQTVGIVLHHTFVIVIYYNLLYTPFYIWHVTTYMLHHTFMNIPIEIPYRKYIAPFTWSTQFIVPSIIYHRSFDMISHHWSSLLCYWMFIMCYASTMFYAYVLYMKWKYDVTAFVTWRGKDNEACEMRRII